MPQTKSAKKALRQSQKRRLSNLAVLKKLKAEIKKAKKNPTTVNFAQIQSIIDTVAKKKVISKNKAARLKSSLSALFEKFPKTTKQTSRLTKKKSKSKLKKTNLT